MNRLRTLAAFLLIAALAGCASPESRIKNNPDGFAKLTPEQQALVRKGDIGIGMPSYAVEMAMGRADSITERTEAKGVVGVWHYKNNDSNITVVDYVGFYNPYYFPAFAPVVINNSQPASDRVRVFFDNDKVVAIERELRK